MGEKLSFEMDAGVILAKLHRGACETHSDMIFINTGMINDDNSLKPENMKSDGKVTFDLEGGEYELGVVINKSMKIQLKTTADDLPTVKDGKEEDNEEDAEDNDDNKDKDKKTEDKEKENENKPIDAKLTKDEEKAAKEDNKDVKESYILEDVASQMNPRDLRVAALDAVSGLDSDGKPKNPQAKEVLDKVQKAPAEIKKLITKDADVIKKFMEQQMSFAATYLQDYMSVFGGADQAKNITAKKIAVTYLPEDADKVQKTSSWKSAKYQIPALSDEEVRKMKIEQLKQQGNKEIELKNMCFKILYQLNIGK